MSQKKLFVLYDGRAKFMDTDAASIMDTADTEAEAIKESKETWEGYDCIWFKYDIDEEGALVNEKKREDIEIPGVH